MDEIILYYLIRLNPLLLIPIIIKIKNTFYIPQDTRYKMIRVISVIRVIRVITAIYFYIYYKIFIKKGNRIARGIHGLIITVLSLYGIILSNIKFSEHILLMQIFYTIIDCLLLYINFGYSMFGKFREMYIHHIVLLFTSICGWFNLNEKTQLICLLLLICEFLPFFTMLLENNTIKKHKSINIFVSKMRICYMMFYRMPVWCYSIHLSSTLENWYHVIAWNILQLLFMVLDVNWIRKMLKKHKLLEHEFIIERSQREINAENQK